MSVRNPRWAGRRLPEFFLQWRGQWVGPSAQEMTPLDFLDEQKAFPYVVAAAWLFCPETIEYAGCIFLAERFDQANADTWISQLGGDLAGVEAVVNQTRLFDVFGNTDLAGADDDLASLAQAMGECWRGVLLARYPGRDITVEVSDDDDGSYGPAVTFWSGHPPAGSSQAVGYDQPGGGP